MAKRSLGQNFLTQKSVAKHIAGMAKLTLKDTVLEIGPGKGILTTELLKRAGEVVAVEKDDDLHEFLKEKFAENKNLKLIDGDILDIDLSALKNYKLVANIPYNITGEILKKFLTAKNQPSLVVLLVQYEVAKRIVGEKPSSAKATAGKESILSISVKAYGKPKFIKKVKAGSFNPKPKVDSAILLIENISKNFFKDISEQRFFELIKVGFSQKRKKLSNTLKNLLGKNWAEVFEKAGIDYNLRAENLSLDEWKKLFLAKD